MMLFSHKKPYLWIALAVTALATGLTVCLFIIFSPPESPKQPDRPPVAKQHQEAEITDIKEGVLYVRTHQEQHYISQRIRVDHLEDLPELRVQDKIIMTYNAVTGELLQITRKENPVTKLNGYFKGMVISQNGKYVKVRVDSTDSVMMVYVNISNFPDLPTLNPGDIVSVRYNPGMIPTQMDDVISIRRTQVADWGVMMRVSAVTPTGFQIWIGYSGGFPRTLTTTDAYYLEHKTNNGWQPVPGALESAFSDRSYNMSSGSYTDISWERIYGALEPGQYRFCKTVSFEGEDRVYNVEFTVLASLATDLETAVTQTVRYILSRQLINPAEHFDRALEHIPQDGETGFLDTPNAGEATGKTFEQITESHMILDQKQSGDTYTLTIFGMCCGYNNRIWEDSFYAPMLLVMRKNADGTFTATSCKMPTQLYYKADLALIFPEDMVLKILDSSKMHCKNLEKACHEQVPGGVIAQKDMGYTYAPDSTEGKLILQAIKSGKKQKKAYSSNYMLTIFLGETVYYYYYDAGIVKNATDNIYIKLTDEGQRSLKTIFELKQ